MKILTRSEIKNLSLHRYNKTARNEVYHYLRSKKRKQEEEIDEDSDLEDDSLFAEEYEFSEKVSLSHPAGEYPLREKGVKIEVVISSAGAGICSRLYFCMKCIQPLPIFLNPGS